VVLVVSSHRPCSRDGRLVSRAVEPGHRIVNGAFELDVKLGVLTRGQLIPEMERDALLLLVGRDLGGLLRRLGLALLCVDLNMANVDVFSVEDYRFRGLLNGERNNYGALIAEVAAMLEIVERDGIVRWLDTMPLLDVHYCQRCMSDDFNAYFSGSVSLSADIL